MELTQEQFEAVDAEVDDAIGPIRETYEGILRRAELRDKSTAADIEIADKLIEEQNKS